jgi:hypothetical protein
MYVGNVGITKGSTSLGVVKILLAGISSERFVFATALILVTLPLIATNINTTIDVK